MECCFCKEYADPSKSQFFAEIGQQIGCVSRTLLQTDNWYVIPTIGSLTAGYVLLVCKQHYPSLANIADRNLYFEMLNLKMSVESVLLRQLGLPCLTFEHGTPNPLSKGANSVDHVHIHVLPFERPIWQDIVSVMPETDIEVVDNYEDVYTSWRNKLPDSYLLFQDVDQKIYYASDAGGMPSQLFRRCLAPYLGVESWDWRSEKHLNNMIRTMKFFK